MTFEKVVQSWALRVGIGLLLTASQAVAQPETPTAMPPALPTETPAGTVQPVGDPAAYPSLAEIYGDPILVHNDTTGDVFDCQNPSTPVDNSASDLTQIEVYSVPNDIAGRSGWVVAAYTSDGYAQLAAGSVYSMAAAAQYATTGGQTEGRLYEVHDQVYRIGATDSAFQVIDGTQDAVGLIPDGTAALFHLPAAVVLRCRSHGRRSIRPILSPPSRMRTVTQWFAGLAGLPKRQPQTSR